MTLDQPIVIIPIDQYEKLKASYDKEVDLTDTVREAMLQMTEHMCRVGHGPVLEEFLKAQSIFMDKLK